MIKKTKRQPNLIITILISSSIIGWFLVPSVSLANNDIDMSVQVLQRKVTDTNNDFDFSGLTVSSVDPQIAGVSIERNSQLCSQKDLKEQQKSSFWQWLRTHI